MPSSSYSITVAFDKLTEEMNDIIDDEIVALQNALYVVGEDVRDTGNFKRSFAPLERVNKWHWRIVNDATYADILARGRRPVNGRMYGSDKWFHGISNMLKKTEKNIEKRVKNVRY